MVKKNQQQQKTKTNKKKPRKPISRKMYVFLVQTIEKG